MIFLNALGHIAHTIIIAYIWIMIIATLLTWVKPDPYNPIVQILYRLTFPLLDWLKSKIPLVYNGIDLSPLVVIIALEFIDLTFVKMLIMA